MAIEKEEKQVNSGRSRQALTRLFQLEQTFLEPTQEGHRIKVLNWRSRFGMLRWHEQ